MSGTGVAYGAAELRADVSVLADEGEQARRSWALVSMVGHIRAHAMVGHISSVRSAHISLVAHWEDGEREGGREGGRGRRKHKDGPTFRKRERRAWVRA
eukprot:1922783-Rhodomonas_salina.2